MNELGGKLKNAGTNVAEARKASFRTAERRMLPKFRDQGQRAAGPDRVLSRHRSRAKLDASFKITDSATSSFLFINPIGPWGIRDNTDAGGRTKAHRIAAKRSLYLKFVNRDGITVYKKVVSHPGSARSAFWGEARQESYAYIQKRIPEETVRAIEAALAGAGYRSRA